MKSRKLVEILRSIDWAGITPGTYVRYLLMILSIVNVVLTRLGINPIPVSEEELYQTVSDVLTVVVLITNTWCNNSVTENAISADKYFDRLNMQDRKDAEEGE